MSRELFEKLAHQNHSEGEIKTDSEASKRIPSCREELEIGTARKFCLKHKLGLLVVSADRRKELC